MADQKRTKTEKSSGWKMTDQITGLENAGPGKWRTRVHQSWQITTLFESKQRAELKRASVERKHSPWRLLFYFFIHLCSVCIKTHTICYEFAVQWINTYSIRGKIIWSCIFQPSNLIRHMRGPALSSPVI